MWGCYSAAAVLIDTSWSQQEQSARFLTPSLCVEKLFLLFYIPTAAAAVAVHLRGCHSVGFQSSAPRRITDEVQTLAPPLVFLLFWPGTCSIYYYRATTL